MKKFITPLLIVLCVSVVALLAAAALWLVRPETHRPGLEKALSGSLRADVRIGGVSWTWNRRTPGISLMDLTVSAPGAAAEDPHAFSARNIRLSVDLPSLIKKQFKVRSIRLTRPELRVTRTEKGLLAGGLPIPSGGWGGGGDWGRFKWVVDQVSINGGGLEYTDAGSDRPRTIKLNSLEFTTRPPRPGAGLVFEARAGLLAQAPNASFEGEFKADPDGSGWTASIRKLRIGLKELPILALERAVPELAPLALRGQILGAISGSVERIRYQDGRLKEWAGNFHLEGLKCFIRAFKSPLQDLNAAVHFDRDTVVVSSFDGRIAGGEFVGRGEFRNLDKPDPDADIELRVDRVNLTALFPRPAANRPQLAGRASIEIAARVQGRRPEEWLATLQGQGRASIADGVLVNSNILRLIFDKLADSLPGARDAFARTMPPDINQRLLAADTVLAPAELPFIVGNGGVVYPEFRIAGDGFEVVGSGQQGFAGDIDFRTTILLDPQISAYIIYCSPDARAVADAYGRLALPVRFTGTIRNVRIQPDTQYLIQRILSVKGPEYLMKALQGRV